MNERLIGSGCPVCGSPLPVNGYICKNCGASLSNLPIAEHTINEELNLDVTNGLEISNVHPVYPVAFLVAIERKREALMVNELNSGLGRFVLKGVSINDLEAIRDILSNLSYKDMPDFSGIKDYKEFIRSILDYAADKVSEKLSEEDEYSKKIVPKEGGKRKGTCPNCQGEVDIPSSNCPSCDTSLHLITGDEGNLQYGEVEQLKCESCGAAVKRGEMGCVVCGAKIKGEALTSFEGMKFFNFMPNYSFDVLTAPRPGWPTFQVVIPWSPASNLLDESKIAVVYYYKSIGGKENEKMVSVFQLPEGVKAKNVIRKLGSLGGMALQINLQVMNDDYANETDLTRKMRLFAGEVNGSLFKNAVLPLKKEVDDDRSSRETSQAEGLTPKHNPLSRMKRWFTGNK